MRRWLLICLAVPAMAGAKSPAWYAAGAASMDIPADGVELPLMRGEDTDWNLAVVGAFVDEDGEPNEQLVGLTFSDPNHVPESLLGELGLRAGGDGSVVIPELRLGEVVLHDVRFLASADPDILVNLITLPQAAFAVLPSSGVVKVAPASQADALLGAVGEAVQGRVYRDKWMYHGSKLDPAPTRLAVPGSFGDHEGYWGLTPGDRWQSSLGGEVALPEGGVHRGGMGHAVGTAVVGGVQTPQVWFSHDQRIVGPDGDKLGVLGYDTLYAMDIAFDPSTLRIALAHAAAVQATDPASWAVEKARKAYEDAAPTEGDEAQTPPEDEASGDPDLVARESALAHALWGKVSTEEALVHYKAAAGAAGDNCKPYLDYGSALLRSDRAADAAAPLERAATLWDRWDSQSFELRQDIEKGRSVAEDAFSEAQDSSCHLAWGKLAEAKLVGGDHAGVQALYDAHFEFDRRLALVYGVSLLSRGETSAANGVLRQALDAGGRDDVWVRLALGQANVHNGRGKVVEAQVELLSALQEPPGLVAHFIAFGMVGQAKGPEAALAASKAMAEADPLSIPARLGHVLAVRQLGGSLDIDAEVAAIDEMLARAELQRPADVALVPYRALVLALQGDLDAASGLLDGARVGYVDRDFVRALVPAMKGDLDASAAALARLARLNPEVPLPLNWPQPGVTEVP